MVRLFSDADWNRRFLVLVDGVNSPIYCESSGFGRVLVYLPAKSTPHANVTIDTTIWNGINGKNRIHFLTDRNKPAPIEARAHILIFNFLFVFRIPVSNNIGVWKWCCRQTCGSISCGTLSKLFRVNSCTSADTGSWFIDAYISWRFASVWNGVFITGSGIDWKFKK